MAMYLSKAMAISSTISTPAMTWMKKIWRMQPLKEMTLRFEKIMNHLGRNDRRNSQVTEGQVGQQSTWGSVTEGSSSQ